jgi:hypothetical protein
MMFIALFSSQLAVSQINEIGFFLGGANYIGDIGSTSYINPNQIAIGGIFKWNRSPRYSYRISGTYARIMGDDNKSDDARRQQRGFSFTNSIKEVSLGMEFNFLDFNLHTESRVVSPYLYSGLTYLSYNYSQGGVTKREGAAAIPMTLGIKMSLTNHLVLGTEIGARYTLTDNLEGATPPNTIGNLNSDDWYVFTGATLTYTFGQRPCYCRDY